MKKLLLIALPAIALNLQAAEQPRQPRTGYVEISIHDLPPGSASNLGPAIRDYMRKLDAAGLQPPPANRAHLDAPIPEGLVIYPKDHVYEGAQAPLNRLNENPPLLKDYSSLMLTPIDLDITRPCQLQGTAASGVHNRKTGQFSGFARFYDCPTGEVATSDMSFYGMRKISIREQNNVDIEGIGGRMSGFRDDRGNSFTWLSWVSGEVDHQVQKAGGDEATREWLMQYARELVSKEKKGKGTE